MDIHPGWGRENNNPFLKCKKSDNRQLFRGEIPNYL